MTTGRVIKNYNGYYYVDIGAGQLVECRRRGKVKAKILVGDELEITELGGGKGVVEKQLPRRNSLRARLWPTSIRCLSSWRRNRRIPISFSSTSCS